MKICIGKTAIPSKAVTQAACRLHLHCSIADSALTRQTKDGEDLRGGK